jgi:hypothetical protein
MTHEALRYQADLKLSKGRIGGARTRLEYPLRTIINKLHLTAEDVAILEHFVHSRNETLARTVYLDGRIIFPVTKKLTVHRINPIR